MKTNTVRLMLTLVTLAITSSVITCSESTLAGGQKASGASELNGTSWQLVKLQRADDTTLTLTPEDRSKYTITSGRDGRVTSRIDCNRASSTWRSTKAGELQFGSWSRTTAKCGPGSLHEQIVTEGAAVRSYVIKDGHLFLSGMAAGGSYELEPLPTQKPRSSKRAGI